MEEVEREKVEREKRTEERGGEKRMGERREGKRGERRREEREDRRKRWNGCVTRYHAKVWSYSIVKFDNDVISCFIRAELQVHHSVHA